MPSVYGRRLCRTTSMPCHNPSARPRPFLYMKPRRSLASASFRSAAFSYHPSLPNGPRIRPDHQACVQWTCSGRRLARPSERTARPSSASGQPETWPADRVAPAVEPDSRTRTRLSPHAFRRVCRARRSHCRGSGPPLPRRAGADNEPGLIHRNPVATLRNRSSVSLLSAMAPSKKMAKPAVVAKLERGIPVFA